MRAQQIHCVETLGDHWGVKQHYWNTRAKKKTNKKKTKKQKQKQTKQKKKKKQTVELRWAKKGT